MHKRATGGLLALVALIMAPALAQAQEAPVSAMPPLEAYGALPSLEDVAISVSGDHLALLLNDRRGRNLYILNRGNEVVRVLNAGGIKFRGLEFIGDEALLLYKSDTVALRGFTAEKYEMTMAAAIPFDPQLPITTVFEDARELANVVIGRHGLRQVDGTWRGYFGAIFFERYQSGYEFVHGRPFLYEFDFTTGRRSRVALPADAGKYRDWLVNAGGEVEATFDIDLGNGRWTIRNAGRDTIARGENSEGGAGLVGLGPDSTSMIYYQTDPETDERTWLEVPLSGGTPVPYLEDFDLERTYWNKQTGEILGYLDGDSDAGPTFFDAELERRARLINTTFAELNGRLVEWTPELDRAIVHTQGEGDSGSWFLVDIMTMAADAIGYDRPLILPEHVGAMSVINYKAQDGLELDGILTLPPGREAQNLPVIVLPHGGPHARDEIGFDWHAQAYASRGYAVFQPNFRGSTGRGRDFMKAGYGEWGAKMQTDISDGLAVLVANGTVDPERACIVGASYGGYAALAGVTIQQGLYRCAVSIAGISDVRLMAAGERREQRYNRIFRRSLDEELGPRDNWHAISPRTYADRADAPILLIHGRDDTVVLFEQSFKMADALKDAGKPHRLVELEGEDHWLSLGETRQQMLAEAMAFVIEHNPPD